MTDLFGRRVSVTVDALGAQRLTITEEMRIAFDITKTVASETNKATIDLYNLAQTTRDRFKKGDEVVVEAGYAGLVEEIYRGEITRPSSGRSGADFVTTLECGDGAETYAAQSVEQEFAAGTRVRDVIKRVAGEFTKPIPDASGSPVRFGELPKKGQKGVGKFKDEKPSRIQFRNIDADLSALDTDLGEAGFSLVLRRAFAVSGNAKEVMDKLGAMWRFDWSVQDGVFQITSYGRPLVGEAVALSPEHGLIGTPAKMEDGSVRMVSLLIPQLRPGIQVQLTSEALSGTYRADVVRFTGDTHAENWTAEVEARALAQVEALSTSQMAGHFGAAI